MALYGKSTFLKLNKQILEVSAHTKEVMLDFTSVYAADDYTLRPGVAYTCMEFESVTAMYNCCKIIPIELQGLKCHGKYLDTWAQLANDYYNHNNKTLTELNPISGNNLKGLHITPQEIPVKYRPYVLQKAPYEFTENEHTYRVITGNQKVRGAKSHQINLIAREDEPLYDHLDINHYIHFVGISDDNPVAGGPCNVVVSNVYDVNTAHIFVLCTIQPDLVASLPRGGFVAAVDAELLKLRLAKKLTKENKEKYTEVCACIENDFKKNTTAVVLRKVLAGELEKAVLNNITFTQTAATYENIKLEHPMLLKYIYSHFNFSAEFDIYAIASKFAEYSEGFVDKDISSVWGKDEENRTFEGLKINGINIFVSYNSRGQRFINHIRINKDEIAKAISRATCYHDTVTYNLFLKSISRVSIKMHDVLVNGLAVKIHENITNDEYKNPVAGMAAPALKFHVDATTGHYMLEVDKDRSVRINLVKLVERVAKINEQTDSHWVRSSQHNGYIGGYKRVEWARKQLVRALINFSTYKHKNSAGTTIDKCELSNEDIKMLFQDIVTQKNEIIEKSKEFMATAVKLTGAERIEFKGKAAYKVQGALRTYAIIIENAKVYDFDTREYRCIVTEQHSDGAGYDDIATRLLTLKNDSVLQASVNTLRGAAQPQYENNHAHTPEREEMSSLTDLLMLPQYS